jgi:UDP-3-O-acyl-N-acetylglucosamine deacetylase
VRHKILDIIGDLALCGMPILGHVRASRSGHGLHTMLLSALLRDREAWEVTHEYKNRRAADDLSDAGNRREMSRNS